RRTDRGGRRRRRLTSPVTVRCGPPMSTLDRLRRALPDAVRGPAREAYVRTRYRGRSRYCPCCDTHCGQFLAYGDPPKPDRACPAGGSPKPPPPALALPRTGAARAPRAVSRAARGAGEGAPHTARDHAAAHLRDRRPGRRPRLAACRPHDPAVLVG